MRSISKLAVVGLVLALVAVMLPGASAGAVADRTGVRAAPVQARSVTLVTGDRMHFPTGDPMQVSVQRGEGRRGVTFMTQRVDGHLFVFPSDVLALVGNGKLDRRLFDVTTLLQFGYDDRRKELPLIVTSARGSAQAQPDLRGAPARVRRSLPVVRGAAIAISRRSSAESPRFWRDLTGGSRSPRALSRRVDKVWLDGLSQPTLDESVAQIGTPAARAAGLDGSGVSVAVLDTGIDATHPDLASRVVEQRNFTDHPETRDVVGHGTHVASTIAGTGAASSGRYAGVAPGAQLLDAKVCLPFGCPESSIIDAMAWAAAEKQADVVNISLGGPDAPGLDPVEEAVQTLTAAHGTLFVIAAGNSGPDDSTVSSPGSAEAALTVGAVDKSDQLATFSSRGPTVGDAAIKPDITAPGVAITAARSADGFIGEPGTSYTSLSGTSMATPHVAGAAALLAQQHPTWTAQRLKAVLMGAAKPQPDTATFAQGAGRVDVARAVAQSVHAEPASLSFGRQLWPHDDDAPVTKSLTYHNDTASPMTLELTLQTRFADGTPAPAGMFALSASTLTVAAGATASVHVTATSSVASSDGFVGGWVTATSGATVVRSPLALDKEVESYDLTIEHIDGQGHLTHDALSVVWAPGRIEFRSPDVAGAVHVRLPKGRYAITTVMMGPGGGMAALVRPSFDLRATSNVDMDARAARPVSVSLDDREAAEVLQVITNAVTRGGSGFQYSFLRASGDPLISTAQLGDVHDSTEVASAVQSEWATTKAGSLRDSENTYHLVWFQAGRFPTGFHRDVRSGSGLARVRAHHARQADGLTAYKAVIPIRRDLNIGTYALMMPFALPFTRTEHYNIESNVEWVGAFFEAQPAADDSFATPVSLTLSAPASYRAGRMYSQTWARGPFGPGFAQTITRDGWVMRGGNSLRGSIPLFSDGAGRAGLSWVATGETVLYRDGTEVDRVPYAGLAWFDNLPAEDASYRLSTNAERGQPYSLSTRVSASWTFRSSQVTGDPQALPLAAVRFTPSLDERTSAPSGRTFLVPVSVERQEGAPAATTTALRVEVSYDDGASWQQVRLQPRADSWLAQLNHPSGPGYVSLRASATDSAGDTVDQTVIRAYRLRG